MRSGGKAESALPKTKLRARQLRASTIPVNPACLVAVSARAQAQGRRPEFLRQKGTRMEWERLRKL
ncbi:MAG TPA: hypothetical protein DEP35_10310 [Deltaproteobacteria bacterium]|nr:hypothetical protein [Deltaproteobacteria bacterium]